MSRNVVTSAIMALTFTATLHSAAPAWTDPGVNEINRLPMHADFFAFRDGEEHVKSASANYLPLDGTWRFLYVADRNLRPGAEVASKDYDDSAWGFIRVPGMWELHGYGEPIYVNNGYPWRGNFTSNPPLTPDRENAVGTYRRRVSVPAEWKGKDITAHFGSATSNMSLWVNGHHVGYGEDSKLAQEYDVTPYIIPGRENLITVQIDRWCDGTYLEDQDFFRLTGLARENYMYAREKNRITDIRVNADLAVPSMTEGVLTCEADVKGSGNIEARLISPSGRVVATATPKAKGGQGIVLDECPRRHALDRRDSGPLHAAHHLHHSQGPGRGDSRERGFPSCGNQGWPAADQRSAGAHQGCRPS